MDPDVNLDSADLRLRLMRAARETLEKATPTRDAALFTLVSSSIIAILEGQPLKRVMDAAGFEPAVYIRDALGGFDHLGAGDQLREYVDWLTCEFQKFCETKILSDEFAEAEIEEDAA